jgi:hypothetical protein
MSRTRLNWFPRPGTIRKQRSQSPLCCQLHHRGKEGFELIHLKKIEVSVGFEPTSSRVEILCLSVRLRDLFSTPTRTRTRNRGIEILGFSN